MRSNKVNNIKKTQMQWSSGDQRDLFPVLLPFAVTCARARWVWSRCKYNCSHRVVLHMAIFCLTKHRAVKNSTLLFSLKAVTCRLWWHILGVLSSCVLTFGENCANPTCVTIGLHSQNHHKSRILVPHTLAEKKCLFCSQTLVKYVSPQSLTIEMQ